MLTIFRANFLGLRLKSSRRPQRSQSGQRELHYRDGKRPRCSQDSKRPRCSQDSKGPRCSQDGKRPRRSQDRQRSLFQSIILFLALFVSSPGRALEADLRFDLLGGANGQTWLRNSVWNPGNQAYQFSESYVFGEIRPDVELRFREVVRLTARPRWKGIAKSKPEVIGPAARTNINDTYVNEAFLELTPSSFFKFAIGRQNYQWGPAESVNPTSFFFPDLTYRVEPFYEFRGRNMARANFSLGEAWNFVLMAEIPALQDDHLETGNVPPDVYDRRLAFKGEYAWGQGAHNLGVVAGQREHDRVENLVGMYAMLTASDAWQLYTDVLVTNKSSTLYVTGNPSEPLAPYPSSSASTGVLGVRYSFEGGAEWRVESIFNQGGYSKSEWRDLKALISVNPTIIEYWSSRQVFPLVGEHYFYSSIRQTFQTTWLGVFNQPMVSLRLLFASGDESGFLSGSWEAGIGNSGTLYIYGGSAMGDRDSELRRALDTIVGVAYRLSL